jgi:DNA adenine methylase
MQASTTIDASTRVRPFLKWAGGKRQLLHELRRFIPSTFTAYHEPFLGSGAVFFDLWRRGLLLNKVCRLTDINPDLVGCYRALARDVDSVLRELKRLEASHARDGSSEYYRVRDVFNPRRRALLASAKGVGYPADLAAIFIYLNRTGYNGLFRLNARGDFNVPAGRYTNPRICDEETLRSVAWVLGHSSVALDAASFAALDRAAAAGDLVYLDPPYAPLSATARFTSYTTASFSDEDQRQLQQVVLGLARRGCFVVLSNSTAPIVTDLYSGRDARRAGLQIHRVVARRAINSHAGRRGEVGEYVISNVEPRPAPYFPTAST